MTINLCIAASLDGYIADSAGKVDFLFEKPRVEPDDDYKRFYAGVEAILFGSVTYKQLTEQISPLKTPYPEKKHYVFSRQSAPEAAPNANAVFTGLSPRCFAEELGAGIAGEVWLFGGRRLIHSFMEEDLIDRYWLYFMPVLLGEGVPLFTPSAKKRPLKLAKLSKTDDTVKAFYERVRG
jgi:dihydrofolate reductase